MSKSSSSALSSHFGSISRRDFLGRSVAGGLGALFHPLSSYAAGTDSGDGPILVVIHQAGGNDSLNTVIPYDRADSSFYYGERPTMGIGGADVLSLSEGLGFNPALPQLKSIWDDGDLAIVNGVGNPNPTLSHFRSIDIWESATAEGSQESGWLGRFFDHQCAAEGAVAPLSGIEARSRSSLAFRNEGPGSALTVNDPAFFDLVHDPLGGATASSFDSVFFRTMMERLNGMTPQGSMSDRRALDFVRETTGAAYSGSRDFQGILDQADLDFPHSNFPNTPIGSDLANIARYINGGAPTSTYHAVQGGYDTHAGQFSGNPLAGRHTDLLSSFDGAIGAFAAEMKRQGKWDRVILLSYSEFGRKVPENGGSGTDHGAAGSLFVAGGGVSPGMHGAFPSLAPDDRVLNNSLAMTTDFRSVYRTILEQGMGLESQAVLNILKTTNEEVPLLGFY